MKFGTAKHVEDDDLLLATCYLVLVGISCKFYFLPRENHRHTRVILYHVLACTIFVNLSNRQASDIRLLNLTP